MSDDGADRPPVPPPEGERGVHVSRDAPGAPGEGGRKPSKLGFRVQAQRRAKGDDPVFDRVRAPTPAAEAEAPAERSDADADVAPEVSSQDPEEQTPGVLDRLARLFRRDGTDEPT